jgi:hypothetical protein
MAQHSNSQYTIFTKAQKLASQAKFKASVQSENQIQWIIFCIGLIGISVLTFLSSFFVQEASVLLSKINSSLLTSLLAIPLEYITVIILTGLLISKFNSTWFNIRRVSLLIAITAISLLVPFITQISLPKQLSSHPLENLNQNLLLSVIKNEQKTIGTIAKAELISGSSDYLVTVINQLGEQTYIMPNPPFVPTNGQKLWLSYDYITADSNPRISTMGLLN